MWLLFAFLSALFAGLTAILAKCGIENMDSNVATAIRTIVVLIFSWVFVFVNGLQMTGKRRWKHFLTVKLPANMGVMK